MEAIVERIVEKCIQSELIEEQQVLREPTQTKAREVQQQVRPFRTAVLRGMRQPL